MKKASDLLRLEAVFIAIRNRHFWVYAHYLTIPPVILMFCHPFVSVTLARHESLLHVQGIDPCCTSIIACHFVQTSRSSIRARKRTVPVGICSPDAACEKYFSYDS